MNRLHRTLAVLSLVAAGSFAEGAFAEDEDAWYVVPTIVNVLDGSGVTDSDVEEIIANLNWHLAVAGIPAHIELAGPIRHVDKIKDDQGDEIGDGDADLDTDEEVEGAEAQGSRELASAGKKGWKITIVGKLTDAAPSPPNPPGSRYVIAAGTRHVPGMGGPTADNTLTGRKPRRDGQATDNDHQALLLAHDFCHAMSVGPEAGEGGPGLGPKDPSLINRLMYYKPTNPDIPHDTTDDELTEIRKGLKARGYQARVELTQEERHQVWADERFEPPAGYAYVDLLSGHLFDEGTSFDIVIQVNGLLPDTGSHIIKYRYLLDTDNSTSTGVTVGPLSGVDKAVTITLSGHYPFTAPSGTITAQVQSATGGSLSIPSGTISRLTRVGGVPIDAADEEFTVRIPVADAITQPVQYAALEQLAPSVPTAIVAAEQVAGVPIAEDTAGPTVFVYSAPLGATVTILPTIGEPGDSISVTGVRFATSATIQLKLNDDSLGTALSNAQGSFSTAFVIPDRPNGKYFVLARNTDGYADFNMLTIRRVPEIVPIVPLSGNERKEYLIRSGNPESSFRIYALVGSPPIGPDGQGPSDEYLASHSVPGSWGLRFENLEGTSDPSGSARSSIEVPSPYYGRAFYLLCAVRNWDGNRLFSRPIRVDVSPQ